ncbi:hypothetical protein PMIN07_005860 [Paraphaeosphaeria minitans]
MPINSIVLKTTTTHDLELNTVLLPYISFGQYTLQSPSSACAITPKYTTSALTSAILSALGVPNIKRRREDANPTLWQCRATNIYMLKDRTDSCLSEYRLDENCGDCKGSTGRRR